MASGYIDVVIPYTPRPFQLAIHKTLHTHRFLVAVCHRRFGKTVMAVNHLLRGALLCPRPRGRYFYIAPTYRQGKAVAWDYLKHYARVIPQVEINESELRVDLPGGAQIRIFGADNPDSLRGLYADGVVLDEYGLMQPNLFSEVIRPLLTDRDGWALFIGTPNGKNQFYDIAAHAKAGDPGWAFVEYKASQTDYVKADELAAARRDMTEDEYQQEFECSFEASVKGSVFGRELQAAREGGRITRVPYDTALPVDTDWDLGIGDSTAIWFSQTLYSGEVRLIDYYENTGAGLPHFLGILREKVYSYGVHWAPHDIEVRELTTGISRAQTAHRFGITFRTVARESLEEGIHAARMLFSRCWFDAERCRRGLEALQHYRWDYNTRINEFKPVPVHDWSSHGADAFRNMSLRSFHRTPLYKLEARALAAAQKDPTDRPARAWTGRGGY